jgi:hypothetical protein
LREPIRCCGLLEPAQQPFGGPERQPGEERVEPRDPLSLGRAVLRTHRGIQNRQDLVVGSALRDWLLI